METHIQSVEDSLIDGLSFRLPNSANFINDRRSVSFFPSGGNEFSPRGVKIIKFMIAGTDWLDPSTVRVQFRLNNRSQQNALTLLNPLPANFFRRLRILAGGQVIEDIDFYNRVYNMVHTLLPTERRMNDYVEGFGLSIDQANALDYGFTTGSTLTPPAIEVNGNKVVLFPLMSGLFNQSKFLPLRFLQGLQIELEVVNAYTDVCVTQTVINGLQFGPASSEEWLITEPQIKCDVISLDNQLDNEYTEHLMQGKTLPINFASFVHQVQAIGGTDRPVISLSRSFTRLKTVFVTFFKPNLLYDYGIGQFAQQVANHLPLRECNHFYHPQFIYPGNDADALFDPDAQALQNGLYTYLYRTEPEMQLQVGAKLFPEIPIRSSQEAYYQLRKALGSHQPGSAYAFNIVDREYRSFKFITAFDCEKQTNVGFSGLNTRAGDLITIKCLGLSKTLNDGNVIANTVPDFLHTTLEYDAILSISDSGVTVLE